MKSKVTAEGLVIPKQWLDGVDEVEIRREHDMILIVPVRADDPILNFGKHPVTTDVKDASVNHDRYLYGP